MILTDVDIQKSINLDLVIHPFKHESITPLGYDLSLGFAINLQTEEELRYDLNQVEIKIPSKTSIFIITQEFIWLSPRIAATLHSRGGLAAKGLILNSTTVDPNWSGRLTMLLYNSSDQEVTLSKEETFSTAIFHVTKSRTLNKPSSNPIETAKFYGSCYSEWFSNKLVGFITDSRHNTEKSAFESLVLKASNLTVTKRIHLSLQKNFPKIYRPFTWKLAGQIIGIVVTVSTVIASFLQPEETRSCLSLDAQKCPLLKFFSKGESKVEENYGHLREPIKKKLGL